MEVMVMNLAASNFAQKLVCLEDIEGGEFDFVYASVYGSGSCCRWVAYS